jgi:hypothetical protein
MRIGWRGNRGGSSVSRRDGKPNTPRVPINNCCGLTAPRKVIDHLTEQYVAAQRGQSFFEALAEVSRAGLERDRHMARQVPPNGAEQERLRQQLNEKRDATEALQAKADSYASEAERLRRNEALESSDHSDLLNRIQELQTQLNTVTAEREKLRERSRSSPKVPDLDAFCKSGGGQGVALTDTNAYGWRCVSVGGALSEIDMYKVWRQQFGDGNALPMFDYKNACSWACVSR